jgi:uncharacterized protein (TIGR03118 family)
MYKKAILFAGVVGAVSCHKNNNNNGPAAPVFNNNFVQTNLVSDTTSYGAATIDPALQNAWGLAVNPSAPIIWISANHSGSSTVYDSTGKTVLPAVDIISMRRNHGGSPTGVVFNPTTDFAIPGESAPAKFAFVNEDGTISAWPLGAPATNTVADRSAQNAVYKGCAFGTQNGATYFYAANFKGQSIDVFDKNWQGVSSFAFKDPAIPAGFGPFNIVNIQGMLYVSYAKLEAPDNEDDDPAPGNGYVDIFTTDGTLVKRFASGGALNSPWGITQAPQGSGLPLHAILVGNFGDGRINIYDSTGSYIGPLQGNGQPIVIEGLWALDFLANENPILGRNKLYFTAGPKDEQHGLFGYLKAQ